MKSLLPSSLAVFLLASSCQTPIVVDENGWPIGFATRQKAGSPLADAPATDAAQPGGQGLPYGDASNVHALPRESASDVPLYSWNGDVVAGADAQPTQEAPRHGIEPAEGGGRMRIIELYQQVLDERDALRDEVEAITAALESAQRDMIELEEQTAVLQARVLDLETAQESMQAENLDLADRLTTAQIRRLEAEKLLLETKIEGLRSMQGEEDEGPVSDGVAEGGA